MVFLFVMQIVTTYFLFLTGGSDPGIIPGRTWNIKDSGGLPWKYN